MDTFKERSYTDKFTLDGRIRPQTGVTKTKVAKAKELLERALRGDIIADATLREAVVSTDASLNVAHLINLQLVPQFDKQVHEFGNWATTRTVPDFRPTVLYSLYWGNPTNDPDADPNALNQSDLKGPGLDAHGAPLPIPEGSPYPLVSMSGGLDSFYQKLSKRGVRFDWTWEARIADTIGFFDGLPQELVALTEDAQYAEFFDALLSVTAASQLAGGQTPDGSTVPAKASLSPETIAQAIYEYSRRRVQGRLIGEASSWNLFVPIGTKRFWDFQMNRQILRVVNGSFIEDGGRYNTSLSNVTLVESDRVADGHWYLLPAPGGTRRPVIEFLKLRGYEAPELRVSNFQGSSVGGGSLSPFEGSFETDSIAYRLRHVVGAVLWSETFVVWSDGTGGPVTPPALPSGTDD